MADEEGTDGTPPRRRIPAWVTFTVLRLLCLAVPLGILLALNVNVLVATAVALVVAAILSNLLLKRWRTALAVDLDRISRGERLRPEAPQDEAAEDAALDEADRTGPAAPAQKANTSAAARPKP